MTLTVLQFCFIAIAILCFGAAIGIEYMIGRSNPVTLEPDKRILIKAGEDVFLDVTPRSLETYTELCGGIPLPMSFGLTIELKEKK